MTTLLVLIVITLAIIAIARVVRILELTSQLSGEPEELVTPADNKFHGGLSLVFLFIGLVFICYTTIRYAHFMLPEPASSQGVEINNLMNVNYVLIFVVFFITQILLFYFAYKYQYNKNRRADYIPENHKLEIIWTVIPTIVLGGMIVYGLTVWNRITAPAPDNAQVIEIYGKQFDWTARYAGKDNKLGSSNFMKINSSNSLGVDSLDKNSYDDILTKELHLRVNQGTLLYIRSQDVIHSVFLPHFRVQMNAVPGMTTQFFFTPTKTTADMRRITKNDKFDYILLCNKICGAAHYTMKMKVVVDDDAQFADWIGKQKTFYETNVAVTPPAKTVAAN